MNYISYYVTVDMCSFSSNNHFKSYDKAISFLFDTFYELLSNNYIEKLDFTVSLYRHWTNGRASSNTLKHRADYKDGKVFHFPTVS